MRVKANGDVGIGTSQPSRLLHLAGSGGSNNVELRLDATDGGERQISFVGSGSGTKFIRSTGTTDNSLVFLSGTTEDMRINANGQVGIGTSNPVATLHVKNNAGTTGETLQQWTAELGTNTRAARLLAPEVDNAGSPFIFFTNNSWQFRVDTTDALTIDDFGDVGIGTTTPGEKLEVNGKIKATDINFTGLATYADDSAAGTGGLVAGDVYKTSTGELRIKL